MDESEIQREKFGDGVNSLPEKTRKSSRYTLWIGILIGATVFFSILPTVWWPEWLSWVGIGPDSTKSVSLEKTIQNGKIVSIKETSTTLSQSAKTFWDWLGLFGTLAVPVLIVILGYELQRREQERAEQRAEAEKSEAKQRADLEREIAATNLREEALQAYLDRMSELLLDKKLNISSDDDDDDSALDVSRTRTLTVLRRLDKDGERKGSVIQFLFDAGLLGKLDLTTADIKGVNLKFAHMNGAYLKGFNLAEADLSFTQLKIADLRGAFLSKAILDHTNLEGADMQYATLEDAALKRVILKSVYLEGADMSRAKLEGANLKDAILKDAHLSGAILRNADLENADLEYASLDGADLASAILRNANLDGTSLDSANLGSANLKKVKSLTQEQVKKAKNWELAHYDPEFRRELGLPPEPKE